MKRNEPCRSNRWMFGALANAALKRQGGRGHKADWLWESPPYPLPMLLRYWERGMLRSQNTMLWWTTRFSGGGGVM